MENDYGDKDAATDANIPVVDSVDVIPSVKTTTAAAINVNTPAKDTKNLVVKSSDHRDISVMLDNIKIVASVQNSASKDEVRKKTTTVARTDANILANDSED